jgi:hypothetical protein
VYRQLIGNKPELEELVWKVQDGWESCETTHTNQAQSISPVNKYIHQVRLSLGYFIVILGCLSSGLTLSKIRHNFFLTFAFPNTKKNLLPPVSVPVLFPGMLP